MQLSLSLSFSLSLFAFGAKSSARKGVVLAFFVLMMFDLVCCDDLSFFLSPCLISLPPSSSSLLSLPPVSVAPADVLVQPPDLLAVLLEHRRDHVPDRYHPQEGPPLDDGHVADVVLDHEAHDVNDRRLRRFFFFF